MFNTKGKQTLLCGSCIRYVILCKSQSQLSKYYRVLMTRL